MVVKHASVPGIKLRFGTQSHNFDTIIRNTGYMTQKLRSIVFSVLVVLPVSYSWGAFYDDAAILPHVTKLVFGTDHIGLYIEGIGELEKPAFILDRSKNKFRTATEREFDSIFGSNTEPLTYAMGYGKGPFVTTDGISYTPLHCERYEGVVDRTEMTIAGRIFPLAFESCVSVSDIEIDGGIVWIGTFYDGDHGDWGAVGLVAASFDTGEEIGRVDTGKYSIGQVQIDPYSSNIWVLTRDRIVVVRRDLEIESSYVFYYDFNSNTAVPEAYITNTPTLSHPLAVFAQSLPPNRHEEFYKAVQSIPDSIARKFSLYDFYMCCNFLRKGEKSSEPEELEILIPFLLSGFEYRLSKWPYKGNSDTQSASNTWRQIACKHRNRTKEAEFLCEKADWGDLLSRDNEQRE